MKEKLLQLMKSEGLTSSRMAEMLEIQPSGISHILAGRNKPGFDLLQKILRRFPRVNPDWLLLDSSQMYRTENPEAQRTASGATAAGIPADIGLFGSEQERVTGHADGIGIQFLEKAKEDGESPKQSDTGLQPLTDNSDDARNPVVRVILIYADRSFEALRLRKP